MILQNWRYLFILCLLALQDGIVMLVNGSPVQIKGTIVNVSADNPAACLLGGFKQLHSAFQKCRTCMAVDSDMQVKVTFL